MANNHDPGRSQPTTSVRRCFPTATAALATALATALIGCGAAPPATPEIPGSFPVVALLAVDSSSGQLHVDLRGSPDPFVRGQNVGQVTITDQSGQPVEGLTLAIVPWMPAHGHGTSVGVAITDMGAGVFVADPLYLFMAGQWELRMTFGGAFNDAATATVDIP